MKIAGTISFSYYVDPEDYEECTDILTHERSCDPLELLEGATVEDVQLEEVPE